MKWLFRFLTGCFLILLSSQRDAFLLVVKYSLTSLPRVLPASLRLCENVITRAHILQNDFNEIASGVFACLPSVQCIPRSSARESIC